MNNKSNAIMFLILFIIVLVSFYIGFYEGMKECKKIYTEDRRIMNEIR